MLSLLKPAFSLQFYGLIPKLIEGGGVLRVLEQNQTLRSTRREAQMCACIFRCPKETEQGLRHHSDYSTSHNSEINWKHPVTGTKPGSLLEQQGAIAGRPGAEAGALMGGIAVRNSSWVRNSQTIPQEKGFSDLRREDGQVSVKTLVLVLFCTAQPSPYTKKKPEGSPLRDSWSGELASGLPRDKKSGTV